MRQKLRELLGIDPLPRTIRAERAPSEKTDDGLLQTKLSFRNMLGETVPAILLEPPGAERNSLAGVVCMSGTSGGAERITHAEFRRAKPNEGPLLGWARELTRRGFVTLSLTLKGTVDRRVSVKFWEQQARMLAPFGRTLMGVMVDEALRGVRVLRDVDAVDSNRLALTGMSLGGNVTWYATACEPDIRAAVPVCGGVGSLRRQILEGETDRHSSYFYLPHLLRYFDHPQIVSTCICPRSFMAIAPTKDQDMPKSGADELIRVVQPAYKVAGQPEHFRVYQPDSTHVYTKQYFEWMVKWLKQYI
jgi:dienelactone hydrolase